MVRSAVTDAWSSKKRHASGPPVAKMSVPEAEGGQDQDDILGFPGDGFQDPEVGDPLETMQVDLDSGAAEMTEQAGGSHPSSAKKRKKSAPVPPDEVVGDRIKQLQAKITGVKTADNEWTQTLRDKLDADTVNVKLAGDRTFKSNQQWVAMKHGGNKEAAPKWSWYGVLFMLAPFGMLSGKPDQYPSVWVCACTKGCRKVYEKKSNSWSAVMDHLANAHGIAKDAKHPSILSKQTAQARAECKQRALDAGMTEARFQSICTTRYIIRRLLPFSHVECPEFRATVHSAWKPITAETQRNLVAEMYLLMVAGIKKMVAGVIATALLPPFWINADLWTSKVTKAKFYGIRIFFKKEGQLETALLAVTLYSPPPKDTMVQIPGEQDPSVKKPAEWLLLYTLKVLEFFGIQPKHVGGTTTDAGSDVRSAYSGHARTQYGWQWMWCMPHMIHCALVQALGTQLDVSKSTNNEARALITSMRSVVRHVNSSTILSKTFTCWQQEHAQREMHEADSTRPDQISAKQLDQQILRRRKQNLKQDVSQRLVHECYACMHSCVRLTQAMLVSRWASTILMFMSVLLNWSKA